MIHKNTALYIGIWLVLWYLFWGFFNVFSLSSSRSVPFFETQKAKEAYSFIEKYYYGFHEKKQDVLEDAFLDALAKSLWDRHTSYFNPKDAEEFASTLGGDFEWIGAVIKENPKGIQIMKVLDGSPALHSGLKSGDIITHVAWKNMIGISADDAVDLIRGPKDSVVELTILGAKESVEKNIKVKRDTVVVPTVQGEILTGTTIGYIEINMFGENTAKEFQKAFQKVLQDGATAIILDGRNNGGGFLDAAVDVLAEFLPENTIAVVTKWTNPEDNSTYYTQKGAKNTKIPLVMLVNELSASATEIVAWAFQDTGRAVIIGEKTYGKWSVQTPFVLSDGSLLKITTAKWYTPKGRSIDDKGIIPDVKIDFLDEDYKNLYDRQLEWAKTLIQKIQKENLSGEALKDQLKNIKL